MANNTLKAMMNLHREATALDSIKNSTSFAAKQAEKHNAEVMNRAEMVYSSYISRGESEAVATDRKNIYIAQHSKTVADFK